MDRHGKRIRLLRLVGCLMALALGLLLLFRIAFLFYFRDFYGSAEQAFAVPGLSDAFVPQGMEAWEGSFLLSGYQADSGEARLVWLDTDGSDRTIRVLRKDGTPLRCHAGGVAVGGSFTYLAGGSDRCYVLATREVMDPKNRSVTVVGAFSTENRASFCCRNGDTLLVGEYACGERYRTAESHHLTTPAGEENPALVMSFRLDEAKPLGVEEQPAEAWSVPERIQGMSFSADGRVLLSASSAFGASQLYLYDLEGAQEDSRSVFHTEEDTVPLYYLDSDDRTETLHMPPKAEEIVFEGDRLHILFESASRRFHYGKLVGCDYVYSLELPPFMPET